MMTDMNSSRRNDPCPRAEDHKPHAPHEWNSDLGDEGYECSGYPVPAKVTLTDFLLARVASDERHAHSAQGLLGIITPWHEVAILQERGLTLADARHVHRWSAARVLAECEAKRRMVDLASDDTIMCEISDDILRLLALPYADHPDYRDEWRPQT